MKNKHILTIALVLTLLTSNFMAYTQTNILLQTTAGDIKILLYDETPLHRDNFIKLVNEGYYDGVLFHRVIPQFMIQTGDPDSKTATAEQPLGVGGPSYKIPAEIVPHYFHKKGALAAARQGDAVNPKKESSGSQFYIVQGAPVSNSQLDALQSSGRHLAFTPAERQAYTTVGGTPHLDNAYTVFGEVTEGLDIVDQIAAVKTDSRNRPLSDIRIIHASIIK